MADTVIVDDAEKQVIRATSDGTQPGQPGYWESVRVEWKAGSTGANQASIRQQALDALAANQAYVASTPTAAQTTAQVKAISRQVNGVIRLLLNKLDAAD